MVACGPSVETRRAADTTLAAVVQAKAVIQGGEVMSARREAQAYFESARDSFLAKSSSGAANALRDAALFTRQESDSAASPAKEALAKSADELDRVATQVAIGSVASVRQLDHTFARAQLAEAQLHCVRAIDAWNNKNGAATGAELAMLADHFERGASDAGQTLGEATQKSLAGARLVASELLQGIPVAPVTIDASLAAMDREVHNLMETASRLKN